MPMGMPYPKGDMAMQKKKMSMSEMMGVEKKMPEQMMSAKMMKDKAKGKKMPFTKKK
jgi:predicted metal-binding transcription factor (methanogenesis marker protein 9)